MDKNIDGKETSTLREKVSMMDRIIAEQKEELTNLEKKYKSTLDCMLEGCQIIDHEWRYVYVNPAVASHGKKSVEELIGRKMMDVYPGIENTEMFSVLRACTENRTSHIMENEFTFPDGSKGWFELSIQPVPIGILILSLDITERKRAEKEIKSSAEEWQRTFNVINDGIVILDINFNIVKVNSATYGLIGKTPEEVIGKKCCDLLHDREKPIAGCPSVACLKSKKPESVEYMEPKFNRWLNIASYPIKDRENKTVGILHVLRDVTERRELEQRLQQSQKMEAIGQLAGGIAHDFNNLLQVIMGYSEILLIQRSKDDPMYEGYEEINNSAKRAASLTRQLLAFSRKQNLQPHTLNPNALAANMEKMLRRIIGEDIELATVYSPELKNIVADAGQIEQVLLNLVVNARDAMPDGGKLTIETRNVVIDEEYARNVPECKPGEFACLSIKDTGTGMDKDTLQRIFEPFFTTKSGEKRGTGLGLSVVYGIVKQHNGFINVYSEIGHGSLFNAYFPALSSKETIVADRKASVENLKGTGEQILLVEDEEGVRKFASLVLKSNGYKVLEAQNANDAISLFKREKDNIDLLFTDMVLPDKTGLQLFDELSLIKPGLKLLVSSGYANHKSQWDTILERKIAFIQKPYNLNDLLDIIRKTLSSEYGI